jgi:hypothetical protein
MCSVKFVHNTQGLEFSCVGRDGKLYIMQHTGEMAKANLDKIMAEAVSADSAVAGQIALVNAQNQNNTWKDEFALLTIALPYWVAMVAGPLGYGDVVVEMFNAMSVVPEYWQETFQVALWAALGITGVKKVLR